MKYTFTNDAKTGFYELINGKWVKITPARNKQRLINYFGYDPTERTWNKMKYKVLGILMILVGSVGVYIGVTGIIEIIKEIAR